MNRIKQRPPIVTGTHTSHYLLARLSRCTTPSARKSVSLAADLCVMAWEYMGIWPGLRRFSKTPTSARALLQSLAAAGAAPRVERVDLNARLP